MSGLWAHMEHPASGLGTGTVAAYWTSSTGLGSKDDLHAFSRLAQAGTGLPLGTRCLPRGPIDGEMRQSEAFACFGLPTAVRQGGTEQSDPLLLTAHKQVGLHIPRIHDVLLRLELGFHHLLLNGGSHFHILDRRHGGLHLHNQLWAHRLFCCGAAFGQMHFLSQPRHLPLSARLSFWIVRRTNHALSLCWVRPCSPLHLSRRHLILLLPDLSEHVHTFHVFRLGWCIRSRKCRQQVDSICPNLPSQGCALAFRFRQAIVLHAMAVALKPIWSDLLDQPVGSKLCQIIQSRTQRFSHTFQIRKRTHSRYHMRRVGSLLASLPQPPTLLAHGEQSIEQQRLGLLLDQARAK